MFCKFLGMDGTADLARQLFALTQGEANHVMRRFKTDMQEKKKSSATINRRLSAVRSFIRFGRLMGLVQWTTDIRNSKVQSYRDTHGPSLDDVRELIRTAELHGGTKAIRDGAIVRLFATRGLRGVELRELDVEHLDFTHDRIFIRGKGKSDREPVTISPNTKIALERWLAGRGAYPGPLFINFSKSDAVQGKRISRGGLWRIVSNLGKQIGLDVWPHGLRHTAITEGLELTDGNVRAVQKFSRHESIETVTLYDDARDDVAGDITTAIDQKLERGVGNGLWCTAHLKADVAADVIYTQQVMRYIREADTLKGTSTTAVKLDKETK